MCAHVGGNCAGLSFSRAFCVIYVIIVQIRNKLVFRVFILSSLILLTIILEQLAGQYLSKENRFNLITEFEVKCISNAQILSTVLYRIEMNKFNNSKKVTIFIQPSWQ